MTVSEASSAREASGGDPGEGAAATEIVDRLRARAEDSRRLSIGEVADTIGSRGYGPFLFVPALVEISPLGAIPTLPTLLAVVIVIVAAQMAFGRDHLWLPEALKRRNAPAGRVADAMRRIRPAALWLDRWFPGRMPALVRPVVARAAAVGALLLCLTVPPLELVPFASSAPMAAIAMFGLATLARDGLLMALAFAIAAAAVATIVGVAPTQQI